MIVTWKFSGLHLLTVVVFFVLIRKNNNSIEKELLFKVWLTKNMSLN